jgi:integrase
METCTCAPSWQAWVYTVRDGKIRKPFPNAELGAAKSWRRDALTAKENRTLRAPTRKTVRQAGDELLAGMRDGTIRNRNRRPFKPSAIRSYRDSLEKHVYPEFGYGRLTDLTRNDVQDFCDALLSNGLDPSTVRNAIMPLRVIYRRAVRRNEATINPTSDLELPAVTGKRERVASPAEAVKLLEALPEADQALWATALYAGARSGELKALQDEDVDLEAGTIRIERSWDKVEGFIEPKSAAGKRTIPICDHLRSYLERVERDGGFFFGSAREPFDYDAIYKRARKAWDDAELEPIGLHECRHSFSSYLDAAGVSDTRADRYMGHANHSVQRRYRHSLDGQLAADAGLLDEFLSGAESRKVLQLREAV